MAELEVKLHVQLEKLYKEYRQTVGLDFLEQTCAFKAKCILRHEDALDVAKCYVDSIIGKAILRLANDQSSSGTI
jgi:hypothetical protein